MRKSKAAQRKLDEYERNLSGPQRARRRYWERLRSSPTIAERFPNVTAITITHRSKIDFPAAIYSTPTVNVKTYDEAAPAVFWFECISRDCTEDRGVESGHELDDAVFAAIRGGLTTIEGINICRAWQDPRRVGRHQCLTKDNYTIEIKYGDA